MRHILKGCSVPADAESTPLTADEVAAKRDSAQIPPTNVPNLVFILSAPKMVIPHART